ncbi:glycoside hydrolase family 3 N-terminal domain-containing protein [Croceibacterium sp. TMG7-5b_MA50]|uniref:glycoside hydrolase family 3 N-terminal domain-containing protein n=1 Tax=Croceibacterium sp. TMG7-5b_MA50 TaxID=3121290 RepID=UPI003221807D
MPNLSRRRALCWLASASAIGLAPAAFAQGGGTDRPLYRDPAAPIDLRVADLLARMTLEEKVGQMIALWGTKSEIMAAGGLDFDPRKAARAYPAGFGQITRPSDRRGGPQAAQVAGGTGARWRGAESTITFVNAVQRWAVEETRLGIPVLFHEESLHGYMAPDATMFPQAIGLAGTFDRDLMRRVQRQTGREVRAHGAHLTLSPVVDIARDPRWGRIEETFGEDPYLCGEMGVASVLGLQGDGETLTPGHVFATLKHMTGHGQPQAGNNIGPAPLAERELREFFFPPFRAVVERTGIAAVMPSYNELDGVPSHANRWLLGDVLRGEWGFDGAIVSDYGGVTELASIHHVAADKEEAARRALHAGVDSELPDGEAFRTLVQQVQEGRVAMADVDRACARMLRLKFRAGMFEHPYADLAEAQRITGDAQGRALALEAARKSLCLLTNDGTLPLDAARTGTIALIGPNAEIARLGGYSGLPRQVVTLADALRARLPAERLVVAQGVRITQSDDRSADEVLLADPAENRRMIAQAVEAARGADVIVLAIGDTEQTSREGFARNHLGDRTDIDIVGEQNELFDALHALGKPVVVCAINGRPPSWPGIAARANALLECWYPGQEGGTAMVDALFGDVNPGAKLPVTVARNEGQLPLYYNSKPSVGRGYLFDTTAPLFPFGHGLSYTTFELSAPRLSASRIGIAGTVEVTVEVRNTGDRAGDEVVQLYFHDQVASVTRPVKELKGFERVTLAPGERRTVRFTLGPRDFSMWDIDLKEVVEPGRFDIMTGADSVSLQTVVLEVG